MVRWFKSGVVAACGIGMGLGANLGAASGQTVERDTSVTGPRGATRSTQTVRGNGVFDRSSTVTGPRGNSVTKSFDSVRGPGGLMRQSTVTGPRGGSITRDLSIQRGGGGGFGRPWGPGPGFGPRPGPFFGPPVIVGGGGGNGLVDFGLGAGLGAGLGLLAGSVLNRPAPPPPTTVVVEQPVAVVPGTTVVTQPSTVIVSQPANPGFDPVADAVGRLKSWHENSRRDGCITLGGLHDTRAIPALVDRLKNDSAKDVRIAAANAISEIGEPSSAVILQRASIYDKKQEVRDAATAALARMPREVPVNQTASNYAPGAGQMIPSRGPVPAPPIPPPISSTPSTQPFPPTSDLPTSNP